MNKDKFKQATNNIFGAFMVGLMTTLGSVAAHEAVKRISEKMKGGKRVETTDQPAGEVRR